jgi:hypothetical protein
VSEFGGSHDQLRQAILGGAIVGPTLAIGRGIKTKYTPGISLWYSSGQLREMNYPNWKPPASWPPPVETKVSAEMTLAPNIT